MFYIGKDYTATQAGTVEKSVRCEKCQEEYTYTMFRVAQGQGSSPYFLDNQGAANRAVSKGRKKLERKLEKEVEIVPCPACAHFQRAMVLEARRRHLRGMNRVALWGLFTFPLWGLVLIIINGTFHQAGPLIPWPIFYPCLLGAAGFFFCLPVLRAAIASGYHPKRKFQKEFQENRAYISCEECGQEYQDLSIVGLSFLRGVAPCPQCGHIQKFMFAAARSHTSGPWNKWPNRIIAAGWIVFLGALLFMPVAILAQTEPHPEPARVILFWSIEGALWLTGIFLLQIAWFRKRTFNPNSLDREHRLAMAKRVSKTRQDMEAKASKGDFPDFRVAFTSDFPNAERKPAAPH